MMKTTLEKKWINREKFTQVENPKYKFLDNTGKKQNKNNKTRGNKK